MSLIYLSKEISLEDGTEFVSTDQGQLITPALQKLCDYQGEGQSMEALFVKR